MPDSSKRSNRFDETIGRLAASIVGFANRNAVAVVVASLALTAGALLYAATHLGINTDVKAMLSSELPYRRVTRQLQIAFPHVDEPLIVVVDSSTPERARQATADLATRLAERPDAFRGVFAPGVGTFFDINGLLYADSDSLQEFADRLITGIPLISQLAREPTLAEFVGLLERSLDEGETDGLDETSLPDLYVGLAELLEAPVTNEGPAFSLDQWVVGMDPDGSGTRRVIIVQPVLDFKDLQSARKPIAAIRGAAEDLGLTPDRGTTVRITGNPAMNTEEMDTVARQVGVVAVLASFIVVTTLLLIALRSLRLVLVTVATLLCGLSWTTGFAALAIGHLNLVSVPFAVLFIGLAVDFGIHFGLHYRELRDDGEDATFALIDSGRNVGSSITLCAVTTAIGFFAFLPTRYAGVAELGLISGTGMFLSLGATLLFYPALLTITGIGTKRVNWQGIDKLGAPISEFPIRYPRAVCGASLLVGALALLALPSVHFDPDPTRARDPGAESISTMTDLLAESPESPWTVEVLAESLDEAERLRDEIEQLDSVKRVVTLNDFIPADQDDKLAILEDLAFFTEPLSAGVNESAEPEDADAVVTALDQFTAATRERMHKTADRERRAALDRLATASERLRAGIDEAADADTEAARVEDALLGDLPQWIDRLNSALEARRITIDDLPVSIRERYLAPDGQARIEVYPSGDLSDREALHAFVDSVQALVPESGGAAIEIVESGRAIVLALQQALTTALIAVTLLLVLLWRNAREAVYVLSALLLAGLLTAATTVVIGLPLNFADVIVIPLLLGIGVDSGIHLVHRYRIGRADEAILRTSTARAVLFSALTTMASFGSLAFSTHRGIASLGALLTLGICFTLIANLIFLPALLTWIEDRH